MKFDKLCNIVLKEAYKEGEVFVAVDEDAIDKFEKIMPATIAKIAGNTQVKMPIDKQYIRQKILSELVDYLPLKTDVSRDEPASQYSVQDVYDMIGNPTVTDFNASAKRDAMTNHLKTGKAFYFAKKLFPRLTEAGILHLVKFKDAKKKTPEEKEAEQKAALDKADKAISGADWIASGTGHDDDLTKYTGGSFGGKEMSQDWD